MIADKTEMEHDINVKRKEKGRARTEKKERVSRVKKKKRKIASLSVSRSIGERHVAISCEEMLRAREKGGWTKEEDGTSVLRHRLNW